MLRPVLGALLLLLVPARARAEVGTSLFEICVPPFGVRIHTGDVSNVYIWSISTSVRASLQPWHIGDLGRFGPSWWWGLDWSGQGTRAATAGDLSMVHLGLGLRAEIEAPFLPMLDVSFLAGAEVTRSSPGLPPDGDRNGLGPLVGMGLEYGSASFAGGLNVTYGPFANGPSGVTICMTANIGSP
jgi:hypothetical protein